MLELQVYTIMFQLVVAFPSLAFLIYLLCQVRPFTVMIEVCALDGIHGGVAGQSSIIPAFCWGVFWFQL